MGFDVGKVVDNLGAPDSDAAPLECRIRNLAASVASANAPGALLTDPGGLHKRGSISPTLASTGPQARLDSPFLRAFAGMPASDTLAGVRPGRAGVQKVPTQGSSSLLEAIAKFGPPAVERQTGAVFSASTARGFADTFRNLDPLQEQARRWRSVYGGAFGGTVAKQVAAMGRPLANPYAGGFIKIKKSLDIQAANTGTHVVQGFSRAYEPLLKASSVAFNSPLLDAIGECAAGFTTPAQRNGEWFRRVVLRPFNEVFERLRHEMERWPRDPYGEPVPFWNVRLYRLAQAAYEGDYVARARFLDEIEADGSPENVLMIEELLKPTFDPQRLDRRVGWEQMDPVGARRWLGRRLQGLKLSAWKEEQKRKYGEQPYEADTPVIEVITSDVPELEFVESELREDERAFYERLRGVVPEQQYWFCWYRAQGFKYEEIADEMGVALGTVKTHARLLKRNPGFLALLGR